MPARQHVLTARRRTETGKSASRELRGNGRVPAVVYGRGVDNVNLSVHRDELLKLLRDGAFQNVLVDLEIDEEDGPRNVLIKDVQIHPVKDRVIHVDLHQVHADDRVQVAVPVELIGESPGVEQENGIIDQPVRQLRVDCRVDQLPASLSVDIDGLEIGDAVMVADVDVPQGVTLLTPEDRTVVSIQPPREFDLEVTPSAEAEVIEETVEEALEEVAEGELAEEELEELDEEDLPEGEMPEGDEEVAPSPEEDAPDDEPAPEDP